MKNKSLRQLVLFSVLTVLGALGVSNLQAIDIAPMTWTPRSDWINIKTDSRVSPHAVGDGVTDDTAAIQSALDVMNNDIYNQQKKTVYFPAGTYKITSTLKTTMSGYSLIGCGLNTIIKWYGASGGAMFWPDGSDSVRYVGFVWDGNSIAGCAYEEYSDVGTGGGSTYMTGIRHENESFRNFVVNGTYPAPDPNHIYPTGFPPAAIISGFDNTVNASPVGEVTIFNCRFYNCTDAIYNPVEIFNNFMWVMDGCEFDNCGTGFSGTGNAGGGADFALLNSHFQQSTVADIGFGYGIRGQRLTSSGSAQFYNGSSDGAGFRDCWVDGWTNTAAAMEFFYGGQASVVDCTFTNPPAGASPPIYTLTNTGNLLDILLSNNYAPAFPGTGIYHQYGTSTVDWVPAGSMGGNLTSSTQTFLQSTAIADSTHILDVTQSPYNAVPGFTTDSTAAIQAAINAARTANNGSIVYIPGGFYKIASTLTVSGGNYTIEGEGSNTQLCWTAGSNGTMMTVTTPQNITVRQLELSAASNPAGSGNDPSYPVSDPTTITSLKETSTGTSKATYDNVICNSFGYGNPGATGSNVNGPGLVLSGLPAGSTVYIPVLNSALTVADSGQAQIFSKMAYIGAVTVSGATHPKTGFTGLMIAEGGQQSSSFYNFTVTDNQNLLVGPYYSEQAANDVSLLRGSGTTTGKVAIEGFQATPTPISTTINVNNFAGRLYYGYAFLTGGNGSSTVQVTQSGANPIDLMVVDDFFEGAPSFTLGTGANLIATLNQDTAGMLTDTPNPLTAANYASIASSMDDFRQLGALNLAVEYGQVNPSGLVAYWKLDETASPSADSSMSGATGTWQNSPTFSTAYPLAIPYADSGSISLNGTNQYVSMGNPANLPSGTNARTICGWARSTSTASGLRVIASFGSAVTSEAMYIGMNGTSLVGGGDNNDLTVTGFWDTNWHFIALTYDGTTAKLYADGVLKTSGAKSWNLVHNACNIGALVNATDFWKGNVDDVRVYNYALSAAQIAALSSPVVANSGFETPVTTSYIYNPTGGSWTFAGNSGVQTNGSAWGASPAPEGTQTAFLQGNPTQGPTVGSVTQSVNFSTAGTYTISFQAARRSGQIQPVAVSVDGTQVGSTLTPSSNSFGLLTSASFTISTTGNHTIKLAATVNTGDNSTFVDQVAITKQ